MSEGVAPAPDRYGRRDLLLAGALTGAAAAGWLLRPRIGEKLAGGAQLAAAIPGRVGAYRVAPAAGLILPPEGELSQRTYVEVVTQLFVAPGLAPIMLLAAAGRADDPGMSVHRPERCYRAAGFAIEDIHTSALAPPFPLGAEASTLTARRDGRREEVFYWTRIGERFPGSAWDQRVELIRQNLHGTQPASLLLRLSLVGSDADAGRETLGRFNASLIAALNASARRALIGR